ncbi:Endolytic peptidoglycan transglycosylase RlpA [Fundidesulfovibrio magnetotacticus]|uniref:Probable endolytic peptidoglycan transglycosylase RlpA n=1 Tax=Fundidesulfovibrio magnetotacticus TaxID=2730080 RepID=A0A6V8LUC6_9BACT|nr:SPOR domain-containing protein [Fundidesulfovibrio magnetotacticus]GFK95334.1 Endolytic peptidoglycan transglycosylase RlpA [Fundidesulfovibrio magnetotacticus]
MIRALLALLAAAALLAGCSATGPRPASKATFRPYSIGGKTYHPLYNAQGYREEGYASWYEPGWFSGKTTANGERLDSDALTCAHKILPMNTLVRVRNLDNGREVTLRVNDRGPFVAGRCLDLTEAGAKALGFHGRGTARVALSVDGPAANAPGGAPQASAVPGASTSGTTAPASTAQPQTAAAWSPPVQAQATASTVAASPDRAPAQAQWLLPGPFRIQVGVFAVRENARVLAGNLVRMGYPGSTVQEADQAGVRVWRVQAGDFATLDEALAAQDKLAARFPGAFVVAAP